MKIFVIILLALHIIIDISVYGDYAKERNRVGATTIIAIIALDTLALIFTYTARF